MPFDNNYSRQIKSQLKNIAYKKVAHLNQVAQNPASVETPSQQDFLTAVAHPELEGGSGNLAASSFDLGIEPKIVGGAKVVKHRKTRTKKLIDAIENTQPITEKALVASGITAAGAPMPKRVRVKKVKGGDFNDVMRVAGDVVSSGAKIAAHAAPLLLAGLGKEKKARKPSEWNTLVSKVRKEKGISLKDAMKHIKDNNLYQKKIKTGGSARFPLSQETVDATLKDEMHPTMQITGNVKYLKFN